MRGRRTKIIVLLFCLVICMLSVQAGLMSSGDNQGGGRTIDNYKEGKNTITIDVNTKELPQSDTSFYTSKKQEKDVDILGGERDVELSIISAITGGESYETTIGTGKWTTTCKDSTTIIVKVQYDGIDGSMELNTTGLGGIDLTEGGAVNAFVINVDSDSSPLVVVSVYSINGDLCNKTVNGTRRGETNYYYSDFEGNCNFEKVGALDIVLEISNTTESTIFTSILTQHSSDVSSSNYGEYSTSKNNDTAGHHNNSIDVASMMIGFGSGIGCSIMIILFVIGGMWVSNCTRILRYRKILSASISEPELDIELEEQRQTSPSFMELSPGSGIYLSEVDIIETDEFQNKWESIREYKSEKFICNEEWEKASDSIQALLADKRIYCIASGSVKTQIKLYCFSKDVKMNIDFLLEIVLQNNKKAKLIVKSTNNQYLNSFIDYFFEALGATCTRNSLPQSHRV